MTGSVKHPERQLSNHKTVNRSWIIATVIALTGVTAGNAQDSTRVLEEVRIEAYRYNRSLLDAPVSATQISEQEFERFNNASLLPAVNTVAGVRMEERSPGSYRFSIRGSLVRSPFGVRNVKMYWNGLPFTDGGGNTYLNLIDLSSLASMEIIKGPGGSLYGAGTGGVVLLKGRKVEKSAFDVSTMLGSFGLQRYQFGGRIFTPATRGSVNYAHQDSDGFREHTGLRRDAVNTDWTFSLSRRTFLSLTMFFTDVFYQTPGGLTHQEFKTDPDQARPAVGPSRGAVEQRASVRNKSTFAGANIDHAWSSKWSSRFGVFGSYSDFRNFAIRNVENRFETNFGGRLENQYAFGNEVNRGNLTFGGEIQLMVSPIHLYENHFGVKGPRTFTDDLSSLQSMFFVQSEIFLPFDFSMTVGASVSRLQYDFKRTFPVDDDRSISFSSEFSPRLALLKKMNPHMSAYGSLSRGFSPPTLAEVRPSTEAFNGNLDPESGINTEVGLRGNFPQVYFDITVYDFNLKNTIVLQRLEDGAEYFINAGETDQRGIEVSANWSPLQTLKLSSTYSYSHYRFRNYVKDGNDFSGKRMTGIPPVVASVAADLRFMRDLYVNLTAIYTDHVPLDDANTNYAKPYMQVNLRAGYTRDLKRVRYEIFGGGNNLLDQSYSLGNDLNAFGGRYYNLAPRINFYAGLKIQSI